MTKSTPTLLLSIQLAHPALRATLSLVWSDQGELVPTIDLKPPAESAAKATTETSAIKIASGNGTARPVPMLKKKMSRKRRRGDGLQW